MPKCVDRTAKAMADQGYNLVKYPRADIDPLNVVADVGGRFEWLGPITDVWSSAVPVPTPNISAAPNFEYTQSNEYRGAFGLQILQGLLRNIGGSGRTSVSKQTTLTFKYHDPERYVVSPLQVGAFLKAGDLDVANPFLAAFLGGDDQSDFFVITEVLRSQGLTVTAANSNAKELAADVQAMGNLANGTISASATEESQKSIMFEGTQPLTFAFKAFEIAFVDGAWTVLGVASNAEFLSAEAREEPRLFTGGSPVAILSRG